MCQCGFAGVLGKDRYSTLRSEAHGEQQVCAPVQGVVDLGPGQVAVVVRKGNGVRVSGRKCSGKFRHGAESYAVTIGVRNSSLRSGAPW